MFVFLPKDKINFTCLKYKLIVLLEEKVWRPEVQIATLHEIKEGEDFINRSHEALRRDAETGQSENTVAGFPNKLLKALSKTAL